MRRVAAFVSTAAIMLVALAAHADTPIDASAVTLPTPLPARYLRTLAHDPSGYDPRRSVVATDLLLGDLLFHSPAVLGEEARKIGLSCNSCHPNGARNTSLLLGDLSDKPGNVDLTTAHFRAGAENHIADFVRIPSLRGVRFTAPYGHDGRTASLTEFTDSVVSSEFGGAILSRPQVAALVHYLQDLDFLPNSNLDARGNLSPRAGDAAKRGLAAFELPRAGFHGLSCASCHSPSTFFRDGRTHRLGSGHSPSPHAIDDGEETPTLLGLAETAPYFHDGRFATLADVVAWFDATFELKMSARERSDLTAYLTAVGAVDTPSDTRPLAQRMIDTFVFLELLLSGDSIDDRAVWTMALDACARVLANSSIPETVSNRAHDDLQKLGALKTRVLAGASLASLREEVRSLSRELPRLAADWAGSLASP